MPIFKLLLKNSCNPYFKKAHLKVVLFSYKNILILEYSEQIDNFAPLCETE